MIKTIFILIILLPSASFSKVIESFSCGETLSHAYINGILNKSRNEAEDSAIKITNLLNTESEIELAFNQSQGAVKDLSNALLQKVEERNYPVKLMGKFWAKISLPMVDNRASILEQLKSIKKDKELIVISHSQGNLYANIACEDISFKNIQIATPASKINCGKSHHYTTLTSDEMYQFVYSLSKGSMETPPALLGIKNDIINFMTSVAFRNVAINTPVSPPLKANVSQQNSNLSIFDKNVDPEKLFEKHSVLNYLNYPPSKKHIQKNYNQVLSGVNTQSQILKTKHYNINCKNVDRFVDSELTIVGEYLSNNQVRKASLFTDYKIEKIDENKYQLVENSRFYLLLTILIILALFFHKKLVWAIRLWTMAVISGINNSDDEEDKKP